MSNVDAIRLQIEAKVSEAKHMSKPDAGNTIVFYDTTGRWVFEVYQPNESDWRVERGSGEWAAE